MICPVQFDITAWKHQVLVFVFYLLSFKSISYLSAGTNVTYRVQSDDMLLSGLSVLRGNIPQNITVTPQMMTQHGPGCHQLTLYASNMVTFPEVSAHLQVNQR